MSKRFTDTDKYKKQFMRGLPAPYKLFWDYLLCECDYAGVWIVDMEIAQVCLGKDVHVDKDNALKLFNTGKARIYPFDDGKKWFILEFVQFQYGKLSEKNLAHRSVINKIKESGLEKFIDFESGEIKPLPSPFSAPTTGAKEKEKDMEKKEDKEKDNNAPPEKTIQETVVELYHQLCPSLPKVTVLNKQRKESIPVRVKEIGGMEKVKELLLKVEQSDFLAGRKTNFRCNFDWIFCCKTNWIKIVEDYYKNVVPGNNMQIGQIINDEQSADILKKANF